MSVVAKVFKNGRSQAIRIPKKLRVPTREVYIEKDGERLIIVPKYEDRTRKIGEILRELKEFSDEDLRLDVEDLPLEERSL